MQKSDLKPGVLVYWNDPDNGICSKEILIKEVEFKGNTVIIDDSDGITLECHLRELELLPTEKALIVLWENEPQFIVLAESLEKAQAAVDKAVNVVGSRNEEFDYGQVAFVLRKRGYNVRTCMREYSPE